jgi:hypothetical protein
MIEIMIFDISICRERIQAEIERRKQAEQEREAMRRKVEDLERSAEAARRGEKDLKFIFDFYLF